MKMSEPFTIKSTRAQNEELMNDDNNSLIIINRSNKESDDIFIVQYQHINNHLIFLRYYFLE